LIGSKTLVDGNVVVEEGPVLVAMRSGCPILLDELDAAQANNIMCLQGILEGESFYFSLTGEYIKPQPGFNVFATGNTKGKGSDSGRYIGTNILNDAFLERFGVVFEQEFPNIAVEQKMIENWLSEYEIVDTQFSSELATWAQAIRKTFFDGGLEDLIATRRLKHIVKAYSIFRDKKKAIHLSTGRFDGMTADAFRKLFDKIHTEVVVA
jgi:MoxR-like ATPase